MSKVPAILSVRYADLADPADARAIVALLDAYASDPMGAAEGLPEDAKSRLVPALRRVPGCLVVLAETRETAVGLAVCFPGFSTFRALPLINVHDLAVLPGYRGRGIGSALLRAVEAQARKRGCCKVTLEVREDNAEARRLYRRCGFGAAEVDGRVTQYLFLEKCL